MARKSKEVRREAVKAAEKLNEIQRLLKEAEEEEVNKLESVEKQISDIAEQNGMFCGVILTAQDVLNVVDMALKTHETIKVPFKLYYNE